MKKAIVSRRQLWGVLLCASAIACSAEEGSTDISSTPVDTIPSFDEFRNNAYPLPEGGYLVAGSIPVSDDAALRQEYQLNFGTPTSADTGVVDGKALKITQTRPKLAVSVISGQRNVWSNADKRNLTYCISLDFGGMRDFMVTAMKRAVKSWESAIDVDFSRVEPVVFCNSQAQSHVFAVVPADFQPVSQFTPPAVAFHPNASPAQRRLRINREYLQRLVSQPNGMEVMVGLIRHQLGLILGFRPEFIPGQNFASNCIGQSDAQPLTVPDPDSVMNPVMCRQTAFPRDLSPSDIAGGIAVYGASGTRPLQSSTPLSSSGAINANDFVAFRGLQIQPGFKLIINLVGEGNADLVVTDGITLDMQNHGTLCASRGPTSNEVCEVDPRFINPNTRQFSVAVLGVAPTSRYGLQIRSVQL